jgi:predicted lipoprotein with Yx(FWY)xxD motif
MSQRGVVAAVAAVGLATAVGACGNSSNSSNSSSSAAPGSSGSAQTAPSGSASNASAAKPSGVKVSLRKVSLGKVLTGPNGHTVYLFMKDKGTKSLCNGKCAKVWSPLTTSGKPQAGTGLKASLLSTSKRTDGTTQVTYGGHPLYYYADDKKPGTTKGEGSKEFGAEWYAVGANGKKVEGKKP